MYQFISFFYLTLCALSHLHHVYQLIPVSNLHHVFGLYLFPINTIACISVYNIFYFILCVFSLFFFKYTMCISLYKYLMFYTMCIKFLPVSNILYHVYQLKPVSNLQHMCCITQDSNLFYLFKFIDLTMSYVVKYKGTINRGTSF